MSEPIAVLFPGQGSQTPDMRDFVARVRPDLLTLALDAVGEDPFERAEEGTRWAQPAIAAAEPEFRAALAAVELRPPRTPVLSGVTAAPFTDVRRQLAESLTHPVRWRECALTLHGHGVRRFIEVGPGRILSGLVRRT